jgi:hypothetical protein
VISDEEMLDELLALESGLTEWELEFVENISHRERPLELSDKQREKLRGLWEKHIS